MTLALYSFSRNFSSPFSDFHLTFSNLTCHFIIYLSFAPSSSVCLPPPSFPVYFCYFPSLLSALVFQSSFSLLSPSFVLISLLLYPSRSLSLDFSVEINGCSLNRRSRGCRRWRPGFSITSSLQLPQHTHTFSPQQPFPTPPQTCWANTKTEHSRKNIFKIKGE